MQGIATLSDIEAIEARGIPALPTSTYEMLARGAARDPGAPALSFFLRTSDHARPETWTYAELLANVTRTANAFHGLGARKDTVIAYVLPNLPETHFVLWGGQAAGIVMAINPLLEAATIGELLNAAKASILVTLGPFPGTDLWSKIVATLASVPSLEHLVVVDLAERVRGPKRLVAKLLRKRDELRLHGLRGIAAAAPSRIRIHRFHRWVEGMESRRLVSERRISGDDYSSFFCTGGTTGLPKIAMRRHRQEVANAWSASQFFGEGLGPGKNLFCGLPLFHVNAVMVTGLVPFSRGAHIVLGTPQGYRGDGVVKRFWEIVERHRIHLFSGVPTLYASLLDVPLGHHDIGSLEYGLCGAAPLPRQVLTDFEARTNLKILEGYGLTEGVCISSANPPFGERRPGSIGLRLPGQAMQAVVLDDEGRFIRRCEPNEPGVIAICGPNVFAGYTHPRQNERLFFQREGQTWLDTGDLGYIDDDGYAWLTGRKKELIIRGGHNIDPAAIEEPLHRHSSVHLAAAVGRPDAHAGELPVAYVQLKPGATIDEAALLEFLRSTIAERAALPKGIRVIDAMPLTAVGKIFKPALKRLEIEDALSQALRDANVAVRAVVVRDDAARGIFVTARIAHREQASQAAKVLGQFPFATTVEPT